MQVWNVLHAACWKYKTQKWRKNSPSKGHRTTLSSCIFDNRKKLWNINISSIRLHNMANFGSLAAVWGTPANFNEFREFASLLQRRRSLVANQTLHDVWLFPGLVHYFNYVHIFGGSCPLTEFCPVQNSFYVQVLRSPILAALLHGTPPASVSQASRHGTRNAITELSQMAPPIFGWVA